MDTFKKLFGMSSDSKNESSIESQVNKSMFVTPSKEKKHFPSRFKEDPGPLKTKMTSHKRTAVKTVSDNKKHIDEKLKSLNLEAAESLLIKREAADLKGFFDLTPEELTADLTKLDDDKGNSAIIKEAILFLHKNGALIQKLENQEQGLDFSLPIPNKEESELVQHLRAASDKQAGECKKLREEIAVLRKERNRSQEELAKTQTELDGKSKKIAELKYNIRCNNAKLQEYQKRIKQQTTSLDEIRKMHDHEQLTAAKNLAALKAEKAKLIANLEEERATRIRLERENDELTRENAMRMEEEKLYKGRTQTVYKLNESAPSLIESVSTFRYVIECPTVFLVAAKMIIRMLEPKDIACLLSTSKRVNEALSADKMLWIHSIQQVTKKAKSTFKGLNKTIETLKDDDKRFAFLKTMDVSTDEEMKKIIDEYICQRKRLGESIAKIIQDCKSFIYTGDVQTDAKRRVSMVGVAKSQESSGGFFGALGGMLGLGGVGSTPAKDNPLKEEDPSIVLTSIVMSEKNISPESINSTLTNTAKKLASLHQEKVSKWVVTLQKCFAILFKATLYFYCEAKEVEKLKDFLTDRFEQLKSKLKETKSENRKLQEQVKDHANMRDEIMKTVKDLNTQIVGLNQERTTDKALISRQEKELKEMKEYQAKALGELTDQKKLLIKEVKLLRKKVTQIDKANAEFLREFDILREIMEKTKERCQDITEADH